MPEPAPQEIRPGSPPAATGGPPAASAQDRFTLRKKFPGEAAPARMTFSERGLDIRFL